MKVIKDGRPFPKFEVKCGQCESILLIESLNDIRKEVRNTPRVNGMPTSPLPAYFGYFVECAICHDKIDIEYEKIPEHQRKTDFGYLYNR